MRLFLRSLETMPSLHNHHFRTFWFAMLLAATLLSPVLQATPAALDMLVYKDGDHVQGRLVSDDGKMIVFRSNRFGELSVPHSQAEVIIGGLPAPTPQPVANVPVPASAAASPADRKNEADRAAERLMIDRLSATLRRYFGPWHGRIAFSSAVVNSSDSTQSEVLEGKMERKWVGDELRFEARYEFSSTNDKINTDLTKGSTYWRHDLSRRWFTLVHPSMEWNRNYTYNGAEDDYVLLQNEVGGGITIWDRPGKKLRLGIAHNFYDVWETNSTSHLSRNIESMFVEAEFALPWSMKLTERGIRYVSFTGGSSGWESQFELSKKFSENLMLALKHEARYNQPDIHVADYAAWHLLLGLDF
jgi:hypothetical protein